MSRESRLPWGKTPEGDHNAHYDYRDIIVVAGKDPYAFKGLADIQRPSVARAARAAATSGGQGRKYKDDAPAKA